MIEIVAGKGDVHIVRGHDYRVLEANGYESVVFGCPPGMVKDFALQEKTLPRHYVIPTRTFVSGRNNFDFEFVVYSFLFSSRKKQKVSVYCSRDQKIRFKQILEETLFGPRFKFLLQAQFRKFSQKIKWTPRESEKFAAFLTQIADDKKLFRQYKNLLKRHAGEKEISRDIRDTFEVMVRKHPWLRSKKIPRLADNLAGNYMVCAQLKMEMDLFSLAEEKDRDKFLEGLIHFCEFDKNQSILIPGPKGKSKIKIVQTRPSAFEIFLKREKVGMVDISHLDPPEPLPESELTEKPFMGVTFLGVGSGFTPKRRNSSLIVWSEGKGILVDAAPDTVRTAFNLGILESDIVHIFLSHVHSDHESGLSEMILSGRRLRVISSRIIFESFMRKMEAVTCFPIDVLEDFIEFFEVHPHKQVKIPGFADTYLTFDYSLHSIPCGRFTMVHKNGQGKETTVSHSGDTKYDLAKINQWYREGIFPPRRYDSLLGFIWEADLIVHDVGGGKIHTKLESLDHISDSLSKKLVLVHQHYDPDPNHRLQFGVEGETKVLIPWSTESVNGKDEGGIASANGWDDGAFSAVLKESAVVKYQVDELVFSQGDPGDEFFILLNGFAELIFNDRSFAIYGEGKVFGELAAITKQRRKATIRAKSPLTLLKVPGRGYKKVTRSTKKKNSQSFPESLDPCLLSSLALGRIFCWNQNDRITSKESPTKISHILLYGKAQIQRKDGLGSVALDPWDVIQEEGPSFAGPVFALAKTNDVYTIGMNQNEIARLYRMFPAFHESACQKTSGWQEKLQSSVGTYE